MTGRTTKTSAFAILGAVVLLGATAVSADVPTPVPPDQRGTLDAERSGILDASNIRTIFWNYGMVGDYPADPVNVDLSVFHSAEAPRGSGMNYSDGMTPFVLTKIQQRSGAEAYIMETGFRERQGQSPFFNRVMRFEPRPGYFQADPTINTGLSPAVSNDPRTWPEIWPDRLDEISDPGWGGSWNGYFGKQIVADQEAYMVLDDQFYDAWDFYPDSRDTTRRGLGLRIEVRGFQWANPQARNVIFWHYDITNESTTDYDEMIFGMYMDSGVGGSALSCDGIFESDDDNAFFDRDIGGPALNLVYTWDEGGHGRDLSSNCAPTGYLGYAYLETPGDPFDTLDNDLDGMTNELRNGGPGQLITGQAAIESYVNANYDRARFEVAYGPLEDLPAYRIGSWWTGDEDMDWTADLHDVGADGIDETDDDGEGDGQPTAGEPNFDQTDLNESDQIGLTGFKMNRIKAGQGNPDQTTDNVVFFTTQEEWPRRLYEQFTDPDSTNRFDNALESNYNIGFLFASGPFSLKAGQRERFSLALAYGADLDELRGTVQVVQQIYNANYRFAVPPPAPAVTAEEGDGFVRLSWGDESERAADPVTGEYDFEGYRIYRSTDPNFLDPKVITTASGSEPIGNGRPVAQFDLDNEYAGYSDQIVEGVAYDLGSNTGLMHTWTDTDVTNGQRYYYAVTAYDHGSEPDAFDFYPSENAITVSRTLRGGTILPANVVEVRPNPRAADYVPADAEDAVQIAGRGTGTVVPYIVNSNAVPDDHLMAVRFIAADPDSLHADSYLLADSTTSEVLFSQATDFSGEGSGPTARGILPIVTTPERVQLDEEATTFEATSGTDAALVASYQYLLPPNLKRPGYPDDISVEFSDAFVDTSQAAFPNPARPAKFRVIAHSVDGDQQLDFLFRDTDGDGTLSQLNEQIDIITYTGAATLAAQVSWRVRLDPEAVAPTAPPAEGDAFRLVVTRPFGPGDELVFRTRAQYTGSTQPDAIAGFEPYVVPNPYVGSASFEPERFNVQGRGERRIEFRGLPSSCRIKIYNVRGVLVKELYHDGSTEGYVAWDLRTKDNLDLAPGLYIYHVDAGTYGKHTGKFGVIK